MLNHQRHRAFSCVLRLVNIVTITSETKLLKTSIPRNRFECGKKWLSRISPFGISPTTAWVSIFDMLNSLARRYSHPSIRHLQPSLMPGPCKAAWRRWVVVSHRPLTRGSDVSRRERHANMKNRAGPDALQPSPSSFWWKYLYGNR